MDGPLSLADTTNERNESLNQSHRDTASHEDLSRSVSKLNESTTSLNNRHAPTHSPSKQGTLSHQQSMQSNSSEVNGEKKEEQPGIKFERLKNLSEDELLLKVKEIVGHLDRLEEYHRGDGMRIQKMIGDMYWDYVPLREAIGDCLADNNYAVVSMRMLKSLNSVGIFKNDDIWFPTYYTYNTMWNISDASAKLAKNLADNDAVKLLTLNCGHKPYLQALHSKNVFYVVKASLSILHNIARASGMKPLFEENKTGETIMPFLESEDDMLKILATLTIAHIVDEEENKTLITETGTIKCIVSWLGNALDSARRRFKGFTPQELTEGLNKLAVNDSNKMKIIEEDALPQFIKMLKHEDVREQSSAARIVWTLAFDKDVRQKLVENEELMTLLKKLGDSTNKSLQTNANGALWVIKGENEVSRESKESQKPEQERNRRITSAKGKRHIFLSYSWSDKVEVLKLRDRLRAEGYAIWIDIEKMGGSTLDAMAHAIENAAVVLICMSEKYKQSPNCRTEAEYTYQLKKEYIPLMMQQKYRPDGWLGLILGAKLFFDFSGKYPFEKPFTGLLKELRGRGQVDLNQTPSTDTADGPITMTMTNSLTSHPSPGTPSNSVAFSMGQEELIKWLRNIKLTECIPAFMEFDGRLLMQLKTMRQEAPEFFYSCLERRLNMSLIEILKFTRALEELH
ncbi:uncharacterized protein LOC127869450 isoform X1 [Dreissena polymorpha]|uniref:uncharacterized protein LOC127869450 isoform X1 n=1 Tax=Dreissena polymorpha TaxID=45954 RepID=UPI0022653671|nr:uncharacterized protein LOC127869450 isoform X1 [Dreissena polymorpha]